MSSAPPPAGPTPPQSQAAPPQQPPPASPQPRAVALKHERLKIVSMGRHGAGKSCLIKRFCEQKAGRYESRLTFCAQFVSRYISTIGVDFGVKPVEVEGQTVKACFWDLSGHSEFFEVRNEFYQDTEAMLLVFDVNVPESFAELEQWLREARQCGARRVGGVVCGNKTDLKARVVGEEDARRWAAAQGLHYFETSAKSGENVAAAFTQLFKVALQTHLLRG